MNAREYIWYEYGEIYKAVILNQADDRRLPYDMRGKEHSVAGLMRPIGMPDSASKNIDTFLQWGDFKLALCLELVSEGLLSYRAPNKENASHGFKLTRAGLLALSGVHAK